jgi:hypothetical protein
MPRRPAASPPSRNRLYEIRSALSAITHELHLAERELKDAIPTIAARLRSVRTLVVEIRDELSAAAEPRATKR